MPCLVSHSRVAELGVGLGPPNSLRFFLILPTDEVRSGFIFYSTEKLDLPGTLQPHRQVIFKGQELSFVLPDFHMNTSCNLVALCDTMMIF